MTTMKLRNLPKTLLYATALLCCQISSCLSAAPADLPSDCPTVSSNQRALIDSCCYSTLLPATTEQTSTWRAIDQDGDGTTWSAVSNAGSNCEQSVTICNSTNDWLITQYIDTTLNDMTVSELQVTISCSGGTCPSGLTLQQYSTNTEVNQQNISVGSFSAVGEVVNGNNGLTGLNTTGFYLAIRAESNACVTIDRVSIIVSVCSEETINLVTYLASYPSSTQVSGECAANSQTSSTLRATCETTGLWTTSSSCQCSAGYFLDSDVCTACPVGTYKNSVGNEACTTCPANSEAVDTGNTECTCLTNYMRPSSSDPSVGCTECTVNFFLSGEICTECPGNSLSTGGTSQSCTCDSNYVTLSGGNSTTSETCICQANYYVDSSGMCVRCPANSEREVSSPDSSCMCVERHQTPGGQTVTSDVACSECIDGNFLMDDVCRACPANSHSIVSDSINCLCSGNSVTPDQSTTTTTAECTTCPTDWKSTPSSTLVCEQCPDRSTRPFSADVTTCNCINGYQKRVGNNDETCLVVVEIPDNPLTLMEGSADNPASFFLNLSADSYDNIEVIIKVDTMFQDRVSPDVVMFSMGTKQSLISIAGNDVALSPNTTIEIEVVPNGGYIGNGILMVIITDDDPVGVGFLASQPAVFNESDGEISIILTKNATTARDIVVKVVVLEGRSVSPPDPVTLASGPAENVTVKLGIQNDATGGEPDETVSLGLELVEPTDFSDLIVLDGVVDGATSKLTITIKDDDPRKPNESLGVVAIIGIAAGGAGLAVLLVLIILVCICICRINANRQGFYFTDEDKTTNPPSMLRYSASLRSITSQTVVPIVDGKGQHAEKENEFYV